VTADHKEGLTVMTWDIGMGLTLALGLFVYLVWMLLRDERS
jgi:hypothetical protein